MLKILFLSSHFLPNDGGIARLVTELHKYLRINNPDYSALLLENETVNPDKSILQIKQPRLLKEITAFRHVRKHKGIIISALWYPDGLIASFSPAHQKIVLVHGTELLPNTNKVKDFFQAKMRNRVLKNADIIVANSRFTADLVKSNFNVKSIEIIHPGTNIERFSPGNKELAKDIFRVNDKFVLSTLSVVRRHKGLETIIEALAKIPLELRRNMVLLIGGKGPATDYYKKMCDQKGISDCVKWLGFVQEKNLPDFYRASDLFLLTSVASKDINAVEGFGMVLTEAQACGTAVIGTLSGGISDAVENGNGGFLIEERDSDKLHEIIIEMYNSPELLQQMGQAARLRIEANFSWSSYYDKLSRLFFQSKK